MRPEPRLADATSKALLVAVTPPLGALQLVAAQMAVAIAPTTVPLVRQVPLTWEGVAAQALVAAAAPRAVETGAKNVVAPSTAGRPRVVGAPAALGLTGAPPLVARSTVGRGPT